MRGGALLENGYIKLYRSFLNWEWYGDINVSRVFVHLLLVANHEPSKWRGIEIGRGQRVTSRSNLAKETGLSEMELRTAIKKLKRTGEITIKASNKYSVVTIINYEKYQGSIQQNTNEHPANIQQVSTKEESKNARKQELENYPPTPQGGDSAGESLTVEMAQGAADTANHSTTPPDVAAPPARPGWEVRFDHFWAAYPRKVGKDAARKAWKKRKPSAELLESMLAAIYEQKRSRQWHDDGGRYIPHPATWLNEGRWEDEAGPVNAPPTTITSNPFLRDDL